MTAEQKMRKARSALILDQPFFGSLALKTKLIEDDMLYIPNPEQRTMWTDGVSIGYCPAFVDSLPIDQLKGVLCHEVMHLANAHQCRRGERDPQHWNIAADYAINPLIEAAGMQLPKDTLLSPAFANLEAEAIYNLLPEPPQGPGPGKGNGAGNGPGKQGKGPQEPNLGDPGKCGEVRDLPGKDGQPASESDKAQNAQDWKIATQQAAQAAKMAGKLPGSLARYVDELLEPVVDWREALRQFIDRTARNDYTWKRPNPRYFSRGLILPSLYNQEIGAAATYRDTSGSTYTDQFQNQFASELDDMMGQYNMTVIDSCFDTRITQTEIITPDMRPLKLTAKGGGGTDFAPIFEHVATLEEPPACIIVLTDMCCSSFGTDPGIPVLWVNLGGYQANPPPFGEVVRIRASA